jgi:hypothetical protein
MHPDVLRLAQEHKKRPFNEHREATQRYLTLLKQHNLKFATGPRDSTLDELCDIMESLVSSEGARKYKQY